MDDLSRLDWIKNSCDSRLRLDDFQGKFPSSVWRLSLEVEGGMD
jgi:hypothetical protein